MNARRLSSNTGLALAILIIWAWIALAAVLNESQLNDSLEQFIWAQSLEWGYWKHPPVSTWLMYGAIHGMGHSPWWPYVLSALLYAVTLLSTHQIAQLLFNQKVAAWTLFFLTLHYGFTRRAQVYNHNSVLIAFIALTAWLTLLAVRKNKPIWWLATGLLAGLSLLVKYQALIPLIGILVAIALAGQFRRSLPGILMAVGLCLLLMAPHAVWVVQSDFAPLRYALKYADASPAGVQEGRPVSFIVNQVRYYLPALMFMLLMWGASFVHKSASAKEPDSALNQEQRSWLLGLAAFPFAAVIFLALSLQVRIQAHWGLQTTQFLALALAYWAQKKWGDLGRKALLIWALVQAIAMAIFIAQGTGLIGYGSRKLEVREIPAQELTDQTHQFWNSRTRCPLLYVSGHTAMSAMISAYSPHRISVLEEGDSRKSPWIRLEDMKRAGYLELEVSDTPVAGQDTLSLTYGLRHQDMSYQPANFYLVLKFHAPQQQCQV
ncbi:MAG: glycosyltransferase family 39 protein [Betaproteobacteria bacterium]